MPKIQDSRPILIQEGSHEQIWCHYDEAALSKYVDFSNVTIAFDYQGYFISGSNKTYNDSIEEVQHKIFVSLGVKSGLLKQTPSSLQASEISCMDMLGDFNVTENLPDNRRMKGKLIKENEIYMLGLSSLPLDKINTHKEQCVTIDPINIPANTICKPIHAAMTAYIVTTGNGTIVDPNLLKTSALKYLSNEIKKGEFFTDSMPFILFAGMSNTDTAPRDSVPRTQGIEPLRKKQREDSESRNLTALGTLIIIVLCLALVGSFARQLWIRRKNKNNFNTNQKDGSNGRPIHDCQVT